MYVLGSKGANISVKLWRMGLIFSGCWQPEGMGWQKLNSDPKQI